MLDKLKLFNKEKQQQQNAANAAAAAASNKTQQLQQSKRTSSSSGFSSARSERSDSSLSLNDGHISQIKPPTMSVTTQRAAKESKISTKQSKLLASASLNVLQKKEQSKSTKLEKKEKSPARMRDESGSATMGRIAKAPRGCEKNSAKTASKTSLNSKAEAKAEQKLELRSESKLSLMMPTPKVLGSPSGTGLPKPIAAIKGTSKLPQQQQDLQRTIKSSNSSSNINVLKHENDDSGAQQPTMESSATAKLKNSQMKHHHHQEVSRNMYQQQQQQLLEHREQQQQESIEQQQQQQLQQQLLKKQQQQSFVKPLTILMETAQNKSSTHQQQKQKNLEQQQMQLHQLHHEQRQLQQQLQQQQQQQHELQQQLHEQQQQQQKQQQQQQQQQEQQHQQQKNLEKLNGPFYANTANATGIQNRVLPPKSATQSLSFTMEKQTQQLQQRHLQQLQQQQQFLKYHTIPSKLPPISSNIIYEEDQKPPDAVQPMRPLLRGYNSHVTLPTRGVRGGGAQQHFLSNDYGDPDLGGGQSGYCSDGDAIRSSNSSRFGAGSSARLTANRRYTADIDNGYLSEGSVGIGGLAASSSGSHGKHFLSMMRARTQLPTTIEER